MTTQITAPESILKLVETFEQHLDSYHSSKNETELRREFLDKFFSALGWDVTNEKGYDEAGKEVVHEFSVEVAGRQKKADYAFRVGRGERFDFLVEAKKPSVRVESSQEAAYQIRRYGWSAKIPLNILTDFEHFAVYDCRVRPNYNDPASTGRALLMHYKEYATRWGEIAAIFSPEAVRRGSLAQYTEGLKGKKGTADVDDAFLQEIERWREMLARNIALRNAGIGVEALNYAVQMTIDRIIFLRICEERGIEPEEQLLNLVTLSEAKGLREREKDSSVAARPQNDKERSVYAELCELFKRADTKYNSGLFHFKAEKGQPTPPDDLTLALTIDDKVLKDILSNLYYPKSPYAFLYIPSDILGQVYERFLGKVIRLTAGHQAKVEEKPEVRKAGGVYYTPTYIVDYIVKNTIGKFIERPEGLQDSTNSSSKPSGRFVTPADVAKLKFVDPACGSGTFTLGAYQYLLDWHLDWYTRHEPEKWVKQKALTRSASHFPENGGGRVGAYRLTIAKKKEILLNNIFGVDVDAQAVEVTKLSLLLKVLENASGQLDLGMERVLPDLGGNIKCGNSLIGFDYFEGQLLPDAEEMKRVNPFDWQREFPDVFAQGGFDVVIGNPPYIRIQAMQEWAAEQVKFFKREYKAASKGNYDIYVVFIEKALELLNAKGKMGFILPHKFFNAQYGEPVRGLISQGRHLAKVVHFGDQQIFSGATTYTCLLFLNKQSQNEFEFTKVSDLEGWRNAQTSEVLETSEVSGTIEAASVNSAEWNFVVGDDRALFKKFNGMPVKLIDIAKRIFQGFKTGADPVFILEERTNGKFYSNALKSEISIENTYLRPLYKSGEMKRYTLRQNSRYVIFPYRNGSLISWKEISDKAPKTAEYLKSCKDILDNRENGRWAGSHWYCYSRNQALEIIASPKILTADLNPSANYCFDESGEACFPGGAAGGYGIVLNEGMYLYVLGLLNSKAVDYFHKKISTNFRGGWFGYDAKVIRNIPIRTIDFDNPAEKAQHDQMVGLVESMLELRRRLAGASTPQEKSALERQIQVTDERIDRLVYELYGLTEEEIGIVEG